MEKVNIKVINTCILALLLPAIAIFSGCGKEGREGEDSTIEGIEKTGELIRGPKNKILFVNSYHAGCAWSDGIIKGALKVFNIGMDKKGNLDNKWSEVDLKIFYMDTKRKRGEKYKKEAALKAKALIDSWKPGIVICDGARWQR